MNKKILKKRYLLFFPIFILLLHFPVFFTKARQVHLLMGEKVTENPLITTSTVSEKYNLLYDSLRLESKGLSYEAYRAALSGYSVLKNRGKLIKSNIITIADFTKSSSQKRLFVIDLNNYKILFNTYVAHGQNSGQEFATNFSNTNESLASSLGFYVTKGTYTGENGFSMYLDGMEPGFNDRAMDRSIVMHGADYVSEDRIRNTGYIGRSWGCPAVPVAMNKKIIEKIKGGSCFFIYSNNKFYNKKSKLAHAA